MRFPLGDKSQKFFLYEKHIFLIEGRMEAEHEKKYSFGK